MNLTYEFDNKSDFCFPYTYIFKCIDYEVHFYQSPNGDLSLSVLAMDTDDKIIEIRKDEKFQLYTIFDEFYNSLSDYKDRYGYDELFATGIFSWKSDAPANELAVYEEFIYNYLNIIKEDDVYKLVLINNIKKTHFVVEFNTDRSRYGILVYCVFKLFKNLKDACDGYHQITIDEYLYQKTLAKK